MIMRKVFLALTLALSLAGCATIHAIETAVQLGTATVANPVTPERLNQAENALILVFTGLKTWKTSCQHGVIPPSCREQIAAVQVYTRQLPPILTKLRAFVRNNDQINAITVFNSFTDLIAAVKSQAAQSGVTIRSAP
jgi:hypothetical protein